MNPFKLARGQKVLVNTKTGDGIFGEVTDLTRGLIFLGSASLVTRDGRQPMDGEAVVPADNVAWLQVL